MRRQTRQPLHEVSPLSHPIPSIVSKNRGVSVSIFLIKVMSESLDALTSHEELTLVDADVEAADFARSSFPDATMIDEYGLTADASDTHHLVPERLVRVAQLLKEIDDRDDASTVHNLGLMKLPQITGQIRDVEQRALELARDEGREEFRTKALAHNLIHLTPPVKIATRLEEVAIVPTPAAHALHGRVGGADGSSDDDADDNGDGNEAFPSISFAMPAPTATAAPAALATSTPAVFAPAARTSAASAAATTSAAAATAAASAAASTRAWSHLGSSVATAAPSAAAAPGTSGSAAVEVHIAGSTAAAVAVAAASSSAASPVSSSAFASSGAFSFTHLLTNGTFSSLASTLANGAQVNTLALTPGRPRSTALHRDGGSGGGGGGGGGGISSSVTSRDLLPFAAQPAPSASDPRPGASSGGSAIKRAAADTPSAEASPPAKRPATGLGGASPGGTVSSPGIGVSGAVGASGGRSVFNLRVVPKACLPSQAATSSTTTITMQSNGLSEVKSTRSVEPSG